MSHSPRSQFIADALSVLKALIGLVVIGLLQSIALGATQIHPLFGVLFLLPLAGIAWLVHSLAEDVRAYVDARAISAVSDYLAAVEASTGGLELETGSPLRGRRLLDELDDVKAAEASV